MLPKYLCPHRNTRDWRYWTHGQVFGERGIIAWMERNDMRPGAVFTDPDKETQHVHNLRRPKYLNGKHIRSARIFVDKGKSREWILRKLLPRTKYSGEKGLLTALLRVWQIEGWDDFPNWTPPPPKKKPKQRKTKKKRQRKPRRTKAQKQELDVLKARITKLESMLDDNQGE